MTEKLLTGTLSLNTNKQTENYIYIISGFRKYICGKGGLGGEDPPPPTHTEKPTTFKISNKMESFPYGPECFGVFFFTIFKAILFFSTPLEPFFFLAYQEPKYF